DVRRPGRTGGAPESGQALRGVPGDEVDPRKRRLIAGAEGGIRTHMSLHSTVFETAASAIPPLRPGNHHTGERANGPALLDALRPSSYAGGVADCRANCRVV